VIVLLALAAVGIGVNRYGSFYDSWSGLFGINVNLAKIAIAPSSVKVISDADIKAGELTSDGALVIKKVITGTTSGISSDVYLVFSPSLYKNYLKTGSLIKNINYQILELFSGTPGVPQTWLGTINGIHQISTLDINGKIPPTIAIIPNINVVAGVDSECLNLPGVGMVQDWLTTDMQLFAASFIGIDNRAWKVMGYSTGGWCATEVATLNPTQYDKFVSISGYYQPEESAVKLTNKLKAHYDLVSHINNSTHKLHGLLVYGSDDRKATGQVQTFSKAVAANSTLDIISIPKGGHNIVSWKPYIAPSLIWLAQN
jgi:hypothetical protein